MTNKDFEILVRYKSWNIEVFDGNNKLLTELKCKLNNWFSNYYSGTANINGSIYSIVSSSKGISMITNNNLTIGEVKIVESGLLGRIANIKIQGETYVIIEIV